MKRLVIGGVAAALITGGAGVSFADGGPGPNGNNNWGLCNAFAHNGGGNSHNAGPFAQLQQDASDANQSVADWCAQNGQKPGN